MNMKSRAGSGCVSAFLALLLTASIALNAALLTGCISPEDVPGGFLKSRPATAQGQTAPAQEFAYLREIASSLGLPASPDKTPGDIAFDIGQAINGAQQYKGEVFSDEAFEECKAAIPSEKDTETFTAYHAFMKKIAGRRIVVLGGRE